MSHDCKDIETHKCFEQVLLYKVLTLNPTVRLWLCFKALRKIFGGFSGSQKLHCQFMFDYVIVAMHNDGGPSKIFTAAGRTVCRTSRVTRGGTSRFELCITSCISVHD